MQKLSEGTCASIVKVATQWDLTYDGDGTRVKQVVSTFDNSTPQQITGVALTAYFMGGAYEETDGTAKKYFAIAGMTVAVEDGSGLKYMLTDHLGSVVGTTDANGTLISQQRYLPFGQVRADIQSPYLSPTDFGYTGQRDVGDMGLMDYRARFYDAALGRFIQPDTIVTSYANPQRLNRFTYVGNNPILLNDPTGHWACEDAESCEHSDTIASQELALKHKKEKEAEELSKKPIVPVAHSGVQQGAGALATIPLDPITSTPSYTPGQRVVLLVFGGLFVVGGLAVAALGGLVVSVALLEVAGVAAAAGPLAILAGLHALPAIAIGGFMLLAGLGITALGAYMIWQATKP